MGSALANEVVIPLDEALWKECVQYEEKAMEEEKEAGLKRVERLYDVGCKKWAEEEDMWIAYIVFEREHGRFENVKKVYNRAVHALKDISGFEEKYNLLQVQGHLWSVCSTKSRLRGHEGTNGAEQALVLRRRRCQSLLQEGAQTRRFLDGLSRFSLHLLLTLRRLAVLRIIPSHLTHHHLLLLCRRQLRVPHLHEGCERFQNTRLIACLLLERQSLFQEGQTLQLSSATLTNFRDSLAVHEHGRHLVVHGNQLCTAAAQLLALLYSNLRVAAGFVPVAQVHQTLRLLQVYRRSLHWVYAQQGGQRRLVEGVGLIERLHAVEQLTMRAGHRGYVSDFFLDASRGDVIITDNLARQCHGPGNILHAQRGVLGVGKQAHGEHQLRNHEGRRTAITGDNVVDVPNQVQRVGVGCKEKRERPNEGGVVQRSRIDGGRGSRQHLLHVSSVEEELGLVVEGAGEKR